MTTDVLTKKFSFWIRRVGFNVAVHPATMWSQLSLASEGKDDNTTKLMHNHDSTICAFRGQVRHAVNGCPLRHGQSVPRGQPLLPAVVDILLPANNRSFISTAHSDPKSQSRPSPSFTTTSTGLIYTPPPPTHADEQPEQLEAIFTCADHNTHNGL